MNFESSQFDPHRKGVRVAIAVLLTCAASGYFMGLQQTASVIGPEHEIKEGAAVPQDAARDIVSPGAGQSPGGTMLRAPAPQVVDYALLSEGNLKPNAAWQNHIRNLLQPEIDLLTATNKATTEERASAHQERALNRAFTGAPPTVPHAIDQTTSASCLVCHENGAKVKDRFAAKISHAQYGSCTQCHVPSGGPGLLIEGSPLREALTENSFAGLPAPTTGSRAYFGAPPTIPHPTVMRSDCMSCHGPQRQFGLRTSHPYRQSCVQCHVPSAELDQRQILTEEFPTSIALGELKGLR